MTRITSLGKRVLIFTGRLARGIPLSTKKLQRLGICGAMPEGTVGNRVKKPEGLPTNFTPLIKTFPGRILISIRVETYRASSCSGKDSPDIHLGLSFGAGLFIFTNFTNRNYVICYGRDILCNFKIHKMVTVRMVWQMRNLANAKSLIKWWLYTFFPCYTPLEVHRDSRG